VNAGNLSQKRPFKLRSTHQAAFQLSWAPGPDAGPTPSGRVARQSLACFGRATIDFLLGKHASGCSKTSFTTRRNACKSLKPHLFPLQSSKTACVKTWKTYGVLLKNSFIIKKFPRFSFFMPIYESLGGCLKTFLRKILYCVCPQCGHLDYLCDNLTTWFLENICSHLIMSQQRKRWTLGRFDSDWCVSRNNTFLSIGFLYLMCHEHNRLLLL